MAGTKRPRPESDDRRVDDDDNHPPTTEDPEEEETMPPPPPPPPSKRRRLLPPTTTPSRSTNPTPKPTPKPNPATIPPPSGRDLLSPLSDELLVRILASLSLPHLLAVAPVSRRFYRLAADSQLWKALYYARFVLPRAMRIPGFRDGGGAAGGGAVGGGGGGGRPGHKLHYSGRRTLWADGRRGGVGTRKKEGMGGEEVVPRPVDWKRQYKIRYNWARGKCAVEELKLGPEVGVEDGGRRKMLVKVVEGIAVTVDSDEGLRAWDLKSRSMIASIEIRDNGSDTAPSCIAVDESEFERGLLDVAVGFDDGSFGVWRLSIDKRRLERRYRHEKSSNGGLMAMAFSYPYLLTATDAVLISLYTFEGPNPSEVKQGSRRADAPSEGAAKLSSPYLLTSLDSHTSRPPLALSIRRAGKATVASVAYTFSTRRGWSIGLQDLHIRQPVSDTNTVPEIATTRIAYTTPVEAGGISGSPLSPPATPSRGPNRGLREPSSSVVLNSAEPEPGEVGPTTLCYTHPYLLATLPDNTLVLHMCTSNASSLSISDGIRLWGHTSGISDAEITARGKAVSVSTRGEEMRVWELEGRSAGIGSRSVEIRPWQSLGGGGAPNALAADDNLHLGDPARDWDERRNWVGFDDEMVIVLKEGKGTRESLLVYDFT
ncbi:uncharacterized protein B0H64DRAFT_452977 [Chaetomium fimeti]|uniref:F-box domain-containing protein n=1 Tax=Chaetomium fimeti TaxID=1854472 RepID=A0AAE0LM61_9PEZI|nr:hypothetical protein B0H64DRAFT_452977 [Chaetomium fimeti]